MSNEIEQGTIKVVWIEDNPKMLYSRMFETEKEAEAFAQDKKDYLISRLIEQEGMEVFTWEILPYGRYKMYTALFNQYHKGFLNRILRWKS